MVDTNRARGVMVGVAVGNLLGISVEGWPRRRIAEAYPEGVRDIAAKSGYPDDDDLAQAIEIADAATATGGLDVEDLGRRVWSWGEANGAGMGGLAGDVLALYGGDYPQGLARNRAAGEARAPRGIPIVEASRQAWGGRRADWRDEELAAALDTLINNRSMHEKLAATSAHMQSRDGAQKAASLLDGLLR